MPSSARWARLLPGLLASSLLFHAACGGRGEENRRIREEEGLPATWNEPVSTRGDITFTPGPPGSAPGYRVEVVVGGEVMESNEVEILLREYDRTRVVERALDGPPPSRASLFERLQDAARHTDITPLQRVQALPRIQPTGLAHVQLPTPRPMPDADPAVLEAWEREENARRAGQVERSFQRALRNLASAGTGHLKNTECPPGSRPAGRLYADFHPFNNGELVVWFAQNYSLQLLYGSQTYSWFAVMTRDGLWFGLFSAEGVMFPPAAGIGMENAFGFAFADPGERSGPNGDRVEVGLLEGRALTLSVSAINIATSYTFFLTDAPGVRTGIQLGLGWGVSVDIGPLFFFSTPLFSFSIALANATSALQVDGRPALLLVSGNMPETNYRCSRFDLPREPEVGDTRAPFDGVSESLDGLARDGSESPEDIFREIAARNARNAVDRMSDPEGQPPQEGIPAPSTPDEVDDLARRRSSDQTCTQCPEEGFPGLITRTIQDLQSVSDPRGPGMDEAVQRAGSRAQARSANLEELRSLAPAGANAVEATFASGARQVARNNNTPNRYVDDRIRVIEVEANEPITFGWDVQEIADLVGRPAEDLQDATVCIEADLAGPRMEGACGQISGPVFGGTLRFENVEEMFVYADVDLSTAAGDFPEDVGEWTVQPATLLMRVRPGPPAQAIAAAPGSAWSGAPVTITASTRDAFGNPAPTEATYRLYDADDTLLEEITTNTGRARFQVQPAPASPALTGIERTVLTDQQGNAYDAVLLTGRRFSGEARVHVNGRAADEAGLLSGALDHTTWYLIPGGTVAEGVEPLRLEGEMTFEVTNPGGLSSGPRALTVPAP